MSDTDSDSEGDKIRRTKRSVVVKFKFEDTDSSSDDSDSDGPSMHANSSKRSKKLPSTDECSDDSSASVNMVKKRNKRPAKPYIYDVRTSGSSSDDSWCPEISSNRLGATAANIDTANKATIADNNERDCSSGTDSSDDLTEKCPICLHSFRDQEVGTPNICEHNFCAPCIDEWSNNVQTCPIDRKPFTSIRVRARYADSAILRDVQVEAKTSELKTDFDFTNCEVCNLSDREESMLLCDSCNAGYHMGCLVPALNQIPEGSWYCDNCFASESSEDDINRLIEEMETEIGIPETRLRIRRADAPRIPRTRQSERIRATIRNRRRENPENDAQTLLDISMPGPSCGRNVTTTTMTTTTTTRSKITKKKTQKRKRRRRKTCRKRKTYVVEYDVDNFDNKFSIKSSKRVIKRCGRKTRKIKRKSRKCSIRKSTRNNSNETSAMETISARSATRGVGDKYPKLHLFGNKNALEYFPDDSENDDGVELNNSIENNDGLLTVSSIRSMGGNRGLLRRKNIAISSSLTSAAFETPDVLSNIIDTMDRWHTMTRPSAIEGVKINNDGSLSSDKVNTETKTPTKSPNEDILNAPMYPRNGQSSSGNFNSNYNSPNGFRGGGAGGGSNSYGNSGGYSFNRGNGGQTSFQRFQHANNSNNFSPGGNNNSFGDNFSPRNRQPFRQRAIFDNNRFRRSNINRGSAGNHPIQQGLYDGEDIIPSANIQPNSTSDPSEQSETSTSTAIKDIEKEKGDETQSTFANDVIVNQNVPPLAPPPMPPMLDFDMGDFNFSQASTACENQNDTVENIQSVSAPLIDSTLTGWNTDKPKSLADYPDSDDADDCPAFEYSVESMEVAKESEQVTEEVTLDKSPPINKSNDTILENDEDLVQLDDDDGFTNEPDDDTGSPDQDNENTNLPSTSVKAAKADTIDSLEENSDSKESKDQTKNNENVKNQEQYPNSSANTSAIDHLADDVSEAEEDERSYTPCLDEQNNLEEGRKDDVNESDAQLAACDKSENASINTGIEGMDTELISDDENDNILRDSQQSKEKADKENNNRKSDKDDSFKKVSKSTKERHYRDKRDAKTEIKNKNKRSRSKSRTRSRSRSRSHSRNRGRNIRRGRFHRRDHKRKDIQRYDVRNVIADRQPKNAKDKYGRDTSRPARSNSRSISPRRRRSRSLNRTPSPKFIAKRRSLSRKRSSSRRRTLSRRHRSFSRNSSHRRRRSISRLRRKRSESRSPLRRSSPNFYSSRSRSRDRLINGQSGAVRSLRTRTHSKSFSPKPLQSHNYHSDRSRSRSHSRIKNKTKKKTGEKKTGKVRSKKKIISTKRVSPLHSPSRRNMSNANHKRNNRRSRSKSWENRAASWNNNSPRNVINEGELSWTPPIAHAHASENLTVILKNKDSKRRREKKKKTERRKGELQQRKEKRKQQRSDMHANQPAVPSKEVFASGDNILVSVSFNKDKQQPQQQTTIVTLPPSKDQIMSKKQNERDRDGPSKRSRRSNRDAPRKHKKVDIKPVAIIDLDNSPFKEMTPSPKAVIVLSDSDHENDKTNKNQLNYSMASNAAESIENDACNDRETNERVPSQPQSPTTETTSFEMLLGPKTPPEPHLVKFSISTNAKNKIRTVVNPLHDDNEDDDNENNENLEANSESVSSEKTQQINVQTQQKIGPNTPPESGPCSPDVYDPFEPTKSASQSPNDAMHSRTNDNDDLPNAGASSNLDESNKFDKPVKPVDLVIALINSKASMDAANSMLSSTLEGDAIEKDLQKTDSTVSPSKDKQMSDETQKSSGIHVFSNIMLASAKDNTNRVQSQATQARTNTLMPLPMLSLTTSANSISVSKVTISSTPTKQSPMKYVSGSSLITKLPMPPKLTKPMRHNGNDDNMDIESPYSPGSSDYEDLFEPPQLTPPATSNVNSGHLKKHTTRTATATIKSTTATTVAGKADIFDDLFGSTSPTSKKAVAKRRQKRSSAIKEWIAVSKHSTQMGYGKLNEDQLRILDDLPGSAVELQAKDRFLRKLNRQERVVEEVKLVLKPHYTKKHITKEDYKDILRRAVPKICHNRTGEINPKKIQKLIEAYVKKFRQRRKALNVTK